MYSPYGMILKFSYTVFGYPHNTCITILPVIGKTPCLVDQYYNMQSSPVGNTIGEFSSSAAQRVPSGTQENWPARRKFLGRFQLDFSMSYNSSVCGFTIFVLQSSSRQPMLFLEASGFSLNNGSQRGNPQHHFYSLLWLPSLFGVCSESFQQDVKFLEVGSDVAHFLLLASLPLPRPRAQPLLL